MRTVIAFLTILYAVVSFACETAEECYFLGKAAYDDGRFHEALTLIEQAMELSGDGRLYIPAGMSAERAGVYEKAERYYRLAGDDDALRRVMLATGNCEDGLGLYEQKLDAEPDNSTAWRNYAAFAKQCGREHRAEFAERVVSGGGVHGEVDKEPWNLIYTGRYSEAGSAFEGLLSAGDKSGCEGLRVLAVLQGAPEPECAEKGAQP
ncbi:tetratricopeptide repeat protein [Limisalsivibrio acetivorans]|uniref:tetratricopeptide repeat protein n=1 Tax=Limisalsivibrio acetivorans TaxID=1304888 RepID=UPI0003B59890|nr:hypothetical protein [Limisalsivibrio acetivorans]